LRFLGKVNESRKWALKKKGLTIASPSTSIHQKQRCRESSAAAVVAKISDVLSSVTAIVINVASVFVDIVAVRSDVATILVQISRIRPYIAAIVSDIDLVGPDVLSIGLKLLL